MGNIAILPHIRPIKKGTVEILRIMKEMLRTITEHENCIITTSSDNFFVFIFIDKIGLRLLLV